MNGLAAFQKVSSLPMISRQFEAVIFDCDGTLVDSEPITAKVLVEYVREFGLELDFNEAHELFVGRDMQSITAWLESNTNERLPDIFASEFRTRQAAALRESVLPIAGAHELLLAMTKPFCIASNAPQEKIAINLSVTGLDKFFTANRIFSAYDINVWKPQPDLFLYAAEKLNVDPVNCVVIEDSWRVSKRALRLACKSSVTQKTQTWNRPTRYLSSTP